MMPTCVVQVSLRVDVMRIYLPGLLYTSTGIEDSLLDAAVHIHGGKNLPEFAPSRSEFVLNETLCGDSCVTDESAI